MSAATDSFVTENRARFLSELKEFVRIPSISTLPEHRHDIERAAEFAAAALRGAGIENVEIIATAKHPLVYADWMHAPGKPTVLCYGHYDVQPADPLELWTTPPFEPTERDGNLYGRGTADDKGQIYMHIKAIEALRAVNGEAAGQCEVPDRGRGGNRRRFHRKIRGGKSRKAQSRCCSGFRYRHVSRGNSDPVHRAARADLHRGGILRPYARPALWTLRRGGPNAVFGLIELLAKAKDPDGVIQIPGIYDDVIPPAPAELKSWNSLPFSEREFLENEVGSAQLTGEPGHTVLTRLWARPTLEVHGIGGGFTGAGAKTVIPAKATAKVSIRLVPQQDPEKVAAAFRDWVVKNTPKGIKTEVRLLSASPGLVVNPDHPAIRIAARAFCDVFKKPTVFIRSGGSIPIVGDFATHLNIPTVLMGFGLPDDGLHSPNEKYKLENYYLGIMTIAHFFEECGA